MSKNVDIIPQRVNANRHTQRGMGELERSIEQDGWIGAITVAADGETFDGSARVEKLATAGLREPLILDNDGTQPIIIRRTDIPNADDERAKRLAIAANKIAADNLDWDAEVLAALSQEMDLSTLFRDEELAAILAAMPGPDIGGAGDEFDTTPQDGPTRTQVGELWEIDGGRHRLLVGDCTDAANVARLMGGERAAAVVTDPPYNIDEGYADYDDTKQEGEYMSWCGVWLTLCLNNADCVALTPGTRNLALWIKRFDPPSWVHCWYKPNATNRTGASWINVWEPILRYGGKWRHFHDSLNYGIGMQSDTGDHPCPKSIAWGEWLVQGVADEGGLIYDPFLGSGTTLIAAHQTGRRCYGMEISPRYADVILRRAEAAGLSVVREG